jgi:ABC-type multidrug transport system fused ATPase/permease subunit
VGLFSKIAFTWMTNFMKSGIKMTYAIDDLYPPKKDHYSELHYRKLNDIWQEEMKKPKPSLAKAVFVGYRKPLIVPLVLRFFADALTLLGPILLKKCIEFAGEPDQPLYIGFAYAFALFASAALMAVFNNSYFMSLLNIGANIKSALVGMIYAKAFHLSSKERSKRTIGELVNHMAIDANIFNDMTFYFYPIFTPIIVVMCVVLLWQEIGVSNLAGIGVIILFFPLNFFLGRRMMRLQRELMEIRDSRSKLTNEVLQGIRVIKFFVWESKFLKQISEVRKNELAMLKKLTNMLIDAATDLGG